MTESFFGWCIFGIVLRKCLAKGMQEHVNRWLQIRCTCGTHKSNGKSKSFLSNSKSKCVCVCFAMLKLNARCRWARDYVAHLCDVHRRHQAETATDPGIQLFTEWYEPNGRILSSKYHIASSHLLCWCSCVARIICVTIQWTFELWTQQRRPTSMGRNWCGGFS